MIEKPDVDSLLSGDLGRWLDAHTHVREQARGKSNRRFLIVVPVFAALAYLGWHSIPFPWEVKGLAILFTGIVAGTWCYWPKAKAIEAAKIGINTAIAKSLGLAYEQDAQPGHGFDLARRYWLLPSYDRSSFEDSWSGKLGPRDFTLHEAHLEEERGSGKDRSYDTVFRGAILTISFDKPFHGTTIVDRSSKHRSLFGGTKDTIGPDGKELHFVDMVHPDFADMFSVWSDDQVEARYLVHPRYVERLMDIERAFAGKNVRTLFIGGELVVVIESDNMFESGSINASEDRERVARCVDQFMSLVGLCEALNENRR